MAAILKPVPAKSNLPFDPDHPVPKGQTLNPADLRAKYYKVIDPHAKFYVGDPRLQRDRTREIDPRRTVLFKKIRADPQEIFEASRRYVVDEIFRGRWYDKTYKDEVIHPPDMEALKKKHRFKHDHDMFSILANKYGNEFKGWEPPEKKDFVSHNRKLAASQKSVTQPVSKSTDGFVGSHRKAIQQAQALKRSLLMASNKRADNLSTEMQESTQMADHNYAPTNQDFRSAENVSGDVGRPKSRPSTAEYVNTLPMPPLPGEVPPVERRKVGVYPLHWKPNPKVVELRNRLFEVLSRKHAELKNSFRRFDEDHRGTVDLNELYRVMVEESGIQCTRLELEELWDFFDRDRDGLVKYSDYAKTMGDDALDERDYFQIAHRKAAGKYNEEVRFFDSEEQQETAHFMNKSKLDKSTEEDAKLRRQLFYEEIESRPHNSLFTLKDKKFGSHFNEVHKKPLGTVEGTSTHRLRIAFAERIKEKYGNSFESLFKNDNAEQGSINLFQFSRIVKDLGVEADDMSTNMLFQAFDRNYDGLMDLDDLVECCNIVDGKHGGGALENNSKSKEISFYDVRKGGGDGASRPPRGPLNPNKSTLRKQKQKPFEDTNTLQNILLKRQNSYHGEVANRATQQHSDPVRERPVSALSTTGGFEYPHHGAGDRLYQRAATPLQYLNDVAKQSASRPENIPPRPSSTPPVMQGQEFQGTNAISRRIQSAALAPPPKLSGPLFATTGHVGRSVASAASAATTKVGTVPQQKTSARPASQREYLERPAAPKMRPLSGGSVMAR